MNHIRTRAGLIGLGRMGARLAESAERVNVEIVAALDVSENPFALGVRPELAQVFSTRPEKFWQTDMDVLLISSTGPSHVPFLMDGIAHGVRRFVVEKPFCTGVREGADALRAAAGADARVVVNHGRRYCPNIARLIGLDRSPQMGELRSVSITLGAAGLGCMGVHYLDLFNRLFGGLPETVRAEISLSTPRNARGDTFYDPGAFALLTWPSGQRAFIDIGDDTGIPPIIDVRFTFGRVIIENEATPWRMMYRRTVDRELPLTRYGLPLEETDFPEFAPFGIIEMGEAVIRDAVDDGPVRSSGEHGLDALRVYAAIRHAAATGEVFRFPLPEAVLAESYPIP